MILDIIFKKKIALSAKGKDHLISFMKGISWRVIGTLDTILISYLITGEMKLALSIGAIEVFSKIILFYFHDRTWAYFTNRS